MEVLTCIAIDDEPLALHVIEDYVKKVPYIKLLRTTTNAVEGLQLLQEMKPDVVFLDVQMPDINGIQFISMAGHVPKFILTTAYPEYALKGYELNVCDYLLKPFAFDRFYKAVEKARLQKEGRDAMPYDAAVAGSNASAAEKDEEKRDYIFVKHEYRIHKVMYEDILFIEGLKDYVAIYTADKKLLTLQSMKKMEEMLPQAKFIRVHKSYIVALDKIKHIERSKITIGDKQIPVGDTYRDAFYKVIEP